MVDKIQEQFDAFVDQMFKAEDWFFEPDVEPLLDELQARLPALFDPKATMCPGNCRCTCSYISGCRLIKNEIKQIVKDGAA